MRHARYRSAELNSIFADIVTVMDIENVVEDGGFIEGFSILILGGGAAGGRSK